jgi:hypothetical protein
MPEIPGDKPLLAFGARPKWGVWFDFHTAVSLSLAEEESRLRPEPAPRYPLAVAAVWSCPTILRGHAVRGKRHLTRARDSAVLPAAHDDTRMGNLVTTSLGHNQSGSEFFLVRKASRDAGPRP